MFTMLVYTEKMKYITIKKYWSLSTINIKKLRRRIKSGLMKYISTVESGMSGGTHLSG